MTPIMQKGLSPQQGIQLASLFQQSTKRAMGPSYDIFDQYGGAVKFGIKLGGLYDSGKLNPADIVIGTAAIILSSQTGLSPDVLYDIGRNLFSQSPSTTQPTTQASKVGPLPTANVGSPKAITDKGGNKVELGGYNCTKEGCGYYQDGICKTCGKPGADRAQTDASRDAQGLNGHGYDSSCPSGQSAGFCSDYKKAYDKHWDDLHSSSPVATSNPVTTEKPTTTAEQPIPTTGKSFQSGVQQQLSVPQKSEPSGQEIAGTPSVNNPTTINPTTTSGNEIKEQGLAGSNTPSTNPPITSKQDTGTGLSSGDPNSVLSNTQPLSTTPDQSVSGVQPGQGGGSAVLVPDKGQTATTSQDQGTSGSGGSDDNSGSSGSTSGDSSTAPRDNSPPSDSSSTADRHSNSGGEKNSDRYNNNGGGGDSKDSGGGNGDDGN